MKWPFILRSRATRRISDLLALLLTERAAKRSAELELYELQERFEAMRKLEQQERWRRLKAEGLCKFKDDRIQRALGLLYRPEGLDVDLSELAPPKKAG